MSDAPPLGIVGPYPPFRGGIAQFTERFHRALEQSGQPAIGVSFRRLYPSILFPGKSQLDGGAAVRIEAPCLLDSIGPLSWRKTASALQQRRVREVVFMHWMPFFAPAYASVARRLADAGIASSAIVHNATPHERQPFSAPLSRRFLTRCTRVVALSETVRRDLAAIGIREGVDVRHHPTYDQFGDGMDRMKACEQLGLPPDRRVMLFFGLVRHYKGVDILVDALSRMQSDALLIVAGEWYEDRAKVDAMIRAQGLADRVRLVDRYIPDPEVGAYFSAADVVVQPYRHATQSGVVQTAFHFGCPVVVSGVGGLPEMVEHGTEGLVVAPEDPEALAAALDRLEDNALLYRLADGARAARSRFTWDHFIEPFLLQPSTDS
ncbi:MAG: glycosyltransferase [Bacteroidota bacterium]|nr:glycosyltransferase [Bacteroidota bacterium]